MDEEKKFPEEEGWIKPKGGGRLKLYQKGVSGNPAGRPRKIVNQMKMVGYGKADIKTLIGNISIMTRDEIKELIKKEGNLNVTEIGMITLAKHFMKAGRTDFLDYMIDRKEGEAARERNADYSIPENAVEASKKYQDMMKN